MDKNYIRLRRCEHDFDKFIDDISVSIQYKIKFSLKRLVSIWQLTELYQTGCESHIFFKNVLTTQ
jgi:hypothetical protein